MTRMSEKGAKLWYTSLMSYSLAPYWNVAWCYNVNHYRLSTNRCTDGVCVKWLSWNR